MPTARWVLAHLMPKDVAEVAARIRRGFRGLGTLLVPLAAIAGLLAFAVIGSAALLGGQGSTTSPLTSATGAR